MRIELLADDVLAREPLRPDHASARFLGLSREGRAVTGYTFGRGSLAVSLIAGCHADEPVGPAMLDRLATHLAGQADDSPLLSRLSWRLVPHVNPDGEARNTAWTAGVGVEGAYELASYLRGAVRETPGDDVEFGFPREPGDTGARPENRAVAAFLAEAGPYRLHGSFHGMAFAAGPWFLIEAAWEDRTRGMRDALRRRVAAMGYRPHDVDRGGEKGFRRIDEGFTTRPDSAAMREHFLARNEPQTAALFRPSSMEYVRGLGGDPLTLVSEMPLFLYAAPGGAPAERVTPTGNRGREAAVGAATARETGGREASGATISGEDAAGSRPGDPPLPTEPERARIFVAWARELLGREGPEALAREARRLGVVPMPVAHQMRLQLAFLEEALGAVAGEGVV